MQGTSHEPPPLPFGNAYWVVPGQLMAGGYPGSVDPDETRRKLTRLIDAGIRHVLDLMEAEETESGMGSLRPYADPLHEIAKERGVAVSIGRHPIRDMDIPSPKRLREILDEIDGAIGAHRPVYLHCLGGIGRTGTVVGCYLIRHGLATRETVFDHIAKLRERTSAAGVPSPEAEAQRMVVRSWRPLTEAP
jgi:hypothetical protein